MSLLLATVLLIARAGILAALHCTKSSRMSRITGTHTPLTLRLGRKGNLTAEVDVPARTADLEALLLLCQDNTLVLFFFRIPLPCVLAIL